MINVEFLKSHALFSGISAEDIEQVKTFLTEEKFSKGAEIIREGAEGNCLYLIYSGAVDIFKNVQSGQGTTLEKIAELTEGETFGEMDLVDIHSRSATVKAKKDTLVLSLKNKDLFRLSHSHVRIFALIVLNIAQQLSRRLRKMDAVAASHLFPAQKSTHA